MRSLVNCHLSRIGWIMCAPNIVYVLFLLNIWCRISTWILASAVACGLLCANFYKIEVEFFATHKEWNEMIYKPTLEWLRIDSLLSTDTLAHNTCRTYYPTRNRFSVYLYRANVCFWGGRCDGGMDWCPTSQILRHRIPRGVEFMRVAEKNETKKFSGADKIKSEESARNYAGLGRR